MKNEIPYDGNEPSPMKLFFFIHLSIITRDDLDLRILTTDVHFLFIYLFVLRNEGRNTSYLYSKINYISRLLRWHLEP